MPIVVRLTWPEMALAGQIALAARMQTFMTGRQDRFGMDRNGAAGIDGDFTAFVAEVAAARFLDRYWKPGEPGTVDVSIAEVRKVDSDNKRLIIHPDDRDLPFILAQVEVARLPDVILRGWYHARDAKREDWWQDPTLTGRPAFFVPNEVLRPMEELRRGRMAA